jgi:hypothetical protein
MIHKSKTRIILIYRIFFSYPSSFIDSQFRKYISEYIRSSSFLPFITDEKQFRLLRHKILGQPTPRQSQVATSAATANIDNDQTDDTKEIKLNESIKKTAKKETNYGDKLIVHYTHEKRFEPFKRDMHRVYENVFKNTSAMDLKLIVGNRNRRDAKNELVRKRPKPSILQNKRIKKKYLKFLGKPSFHTNIHECFQFLFSRRTAKNEENCQFKYSNITIISKG